MNEAKAVATTTQSDVALPVGTNLLGDQFTITSRLSAGGFGITYRAKDNFLGRMVVLKECFADDFCVRSGHQVVSRNQDSDEHFKSIVAMFLREARSLAKLRHPNIVGVHRAFEENGTAYMALDLIQGHDLDNILDVNAATLPPEGVKDMLLRLLDAIEVVHDQDLLHRDISPDNIMIEHDGNPVLIDFGAARGDASRRTRAISSLLVVKDGYSPQEFYIAGSIQTPASDLYALAATFYHVLSGSAPPNSQIRMVEVAGQKTDPCVPLFGRIEGYDPAFLKAIDLAMKPLPQDRLQSADQWINMITGPSAPRPRTIPKIVPPELSGAPVNTAKTGEELSRVLNQLVEETNEEVRKTRLVVVEPEPEKPVAPLQQQTSPAWLDEFNEDTLSSDMDDDLEMYDADEDADDDFAPIPPKAAPPEPVTQPKERESDWINRVREKRAQTEALLAETPSSPSGAHALVSRITSAPVVTATPSPELLEKPKQTSSQMIVSLMKVLFAGILLGVGVVMGYLYLYV